MKYDSIQLIDETVSTILMHKNCHFGGSFEEMISYYKADGKGVQPELSVENIEKIRDVEVKTNIDLAKKILSDFQLDTVKRSINCYKLLKDTYTCSSKTASLISDLILSEEQEPENEIKEIVKMGKVMCPYLIMLFESEEFANPLFPGYGFGPELAAKCLGLIKEPSTIPILFHKIGKVDFFVEDAILEAIKRFGTNSEIFLLKMLKSMPFSEDNEKAALALVHFKDSYKVCKEAFNILKSSDRPQSPTFLNYLAIISEGLIGTDLEKDFYDLSNHDYLPKLVREDIIEIRQNWSNKSKN